MLTVTYTECQIYALNAECRGAYTGTTVEETPAMTSNVGRG
jgi:hypothetical protein